jgi:hypothetical protein
MQKRNQVLENSLALLSKKKSGLREFFGTVIKLENSVVLKNNFTQDKFSY